MAAGLFLATAELDDGVFGNRAGAQSHKTSKSEGREDFNYLRQFPRVPCDLLQFDPFARPILQFFEEKLRCVFSNRIYQAHFLLRLFDVLTGNTITLMLILVNYGTDLVQMRHLINRLNLVWFFHLWNLFLTGKTAKIAPRI